MPTPEQINRINKFIYWIMDREETSKDEISDEIAKATGIEKSDNNKIGDALTDLYGVDGCDYVVCVGDDAPLEVFADTVESVINSRLDYPEFEVWKK